MKVKVKVKVQKKPWKNSKKWRIVKSRYDFYAISRKIIIIVNFKQIALGPYSRITVYILITVDVACMIGPLTLRPRLNLTLPQKNIAMGQLP